MTRRRSARLAGASKTPQASSTAPNLSSLAEREESPDNAAPQSLNAIVTSPIPAVPGTPSDSTPAKPPMSEMHPQKAHATMAPPSSSLRLGFTDIKPRDKTGPGSRLPAAIQATPSKLPISEALPSSSFTFRVTHENANANSNSSTLDPKLSSEAQRIMDSIRADVAKYKVMLAAERQQEKEQEEDIAGRRRIAQPKTKSGRFSAAHVAQFKKMDSIANHPSAFRAQYARGTPQLSTLKRSPSKPTLGHSEAAALPRMGLKPSQSKTNMNEAVLARSILKRSQSKANLDETEPARSGLKRSQSKASLQEPESARNRYGFGFVGTKASGVKEAKNDGNNAPSPAKRARQLMTDDTSTNRPVSRDGSFLPRPKSAGGPSSNIPRSKSSLTLLMTPTKSSLARTQSVKSPAQGSMINSSAKPTTLSGLKASATVADLSMLVEKPATETRAVSVRSPNGRLDRVKAMFRGHKYGHKHSPGKAKSNLPLPASGTFKTIRHAGEAAPALFGKTPGSALFKRVAFTPDRTRVAVPQQSPSPVKAGSVMRSSGDVFYPALDTALHEGEDATVGEGDIVYPDLSSRRPLPEPPVKKFTAGASNDTPTGPSDFTFSAGQTMDLGKPSSVRFGGSPGQVSVRQVRRSMAPRLKAMMPGSFPASLSVPAGEVEDSKPLSVPTSAVVANKENVAPSSPMDKALLLSGRMGKPPPPPVLHREGVHGFPHGMISKKRHRVSTDEQEAVLEEKERAAKRARRDTVPEGDALLAPRLMAGSPGSSKKKTMKQGLSLSRLHLLARPKTRK